MSKKSRTFAVAKVKSNKYLTINKFNIMRKIKLFLSCMLMLAFGFGQLWADTPAAAGATLFSEDFGGYSANDVPSGTVTTGTGRVVYGGANVTYTCVDNGTNKTMIYTANLAGGTSPELLVGKSAGVFTIAGIPSGGAQEITVSFKQNAQKLTVSLDGTGYSTTYASPKPSAAGAVSFDITVEDGADATFSLIMTAGSSNVRVDDILVSVKTAGEGGGTPKCTTPTFSPAAGSYEGTQNVTITSTTGATIYYTTDGSTPNTGSSVYSTPIAVSANQTIKAYATLTSYDDSDVAEAAYTITEGPDVTLDFTDNTEWQFPTSNTLDEGTFSDGTYTVKVKGEGTGKGYKFSSGKLLIGQQNAYLLLPEFSNPIEKIVCPGVSGASSAVKWNVYDGETAVSTEATGCTSDVTFNIDPVEANKQYKIKLNSAHNLQISHVKIFFGSAPAVAKPTISGDENFVTSTTVTISHTDADHIYYTTDGTTPTTGSAEYTAPFSLTATATVKAIAVKGSDESQVAEKTFTKATVMTVAEARTAIDAGGDLTNKYVAGIISQIDSYNSTYKSITYWISDDGTTTDQLEVYSGLAGIVKAEFASEADLNVGDDVTVKGTLKKYSSTYEFDKNNEIVARKPIARLAWSGTTEGAYAASLEGGNTFPTLTNSDVVSVSYSSSETSYASFSDASDYSTLTLNAVGSTVITATFAGNESFKANSASYTLNIASSVIKANISYECNGATACPDGEVAASNLPSPLPSVTKAGKNFGGWFMDSEFNTPAIAGNAVASTDPITLYAKWLDPYNITQAKAVIDATPAGTANQYVAGKISQIDSYNSTYHSITYWISDDGTTTDQIQVYSGLIGNAATPLGKEAFDAKENLELGDEVVVFGTLKLHNSTTYEFDKNNTIYSFNRPVVLTYDITYEENGGSAVDDATDQTNLPDPLPTTTLAEKVFAGWWTTSTFDPGTEAVAGAALADDITLYAKWDDPSSWALTYTSNVTVGTDKVVISDVQYDAKKTGTGSVFGSTTVTVPYGTTALHFHAAGWGADAVVNLVVKKGETELATFSLSKDAGIKSSSPFTLAGTPYLQYYNVALTGIAEPTAITFEAKDDGGKRFVIYGVNQEGGVEPVLESIEISGDLDNKTGYKVGDDLDLTGLTVMATYSLAGTPQTPVDITSDPGLTLTYDPLVENQTEVTITATFGGQTDDITITGLEAVASATPEISTDVNSRSWTVTKDADIPAAKTFTVTLNNVAAATAALGGTNPGAFSIDKTDLVNGDVITVSVVSTATVGSYTATLTISDNAGVAADKVVNVNLTVNEPEIPETPVSTTSKWVEATAISNGMEVIIVGVNGDDAFAMGEQGGNNRAAVAGTLDAGVFTPGDNTMSFTLVDQGDGTYAIRTSGGKYLYAASSTKNYLRTQATVDENAKWTLTVASAEAASSSNNHVMQFNSGSSIFSCYATASQKAIAFYVPQAVAPVADYTRDDSWIAPGQLGTVCISHGVASVNGANIYQLAGKQAGGNVVFESVATMEPGKPYLFEATADVVEFFYSAEAEAASAGNHKGMYGTFGDITITDDLANTYYFAGHTLWSAVDLTSTGLSVPANRAYIKMDQVPNMSASPAPGKRYITLSVNGNNGTTGIGELNASETPVKMIIDGKLFILRGEKMYNANGQLVK